MIDGGDRRHAADRRRKPAIRTDDPQPARPFADEHAPIGQELQRPGMDKPAGEDLDLVGAFRRRRRRGLLGGGRRQEEGGQDCCKPGSHCALVRCRSKLADIVTADRGNSRRPLAESLVVFRVGCSLYGGYEQG